MSNGNDYAIFNPAQMIFSIPTSVDPSMLYGKSRLVKREKNQIQNDLVLGRKKVDSEAASTTLDVMKPQINIIRASPS